MPYKNYFKVFILLVLMLALSQITFASLAESKCGIDIFNEYYGGNVGPEDIYGVFDVKEKNTYKTIRLAKRKY